MQPMGTSVMSDQDVEDQNFQNLLGSFRAETLGPGTMTNADAQRIRQALDENKIDQTQINKMLLSDIQPLESKDMMQSRMPDLSVMQPLVDLGYEQEVRTMLTFPIDSPESKSAQRKIITDLGTGIDIDNFLMELEKVAPKDVTTTMGNIESIQDDSSRMVPMSMQTTEGADLTEMLKRSGRFGDTTVGHLSEGEVVVPPEVLQANPPIADALDETMTQMGVDPRTRIVDTTGELGGIASINPDTGLQEFFFKSALSKLNRARKKITKTLAPVVVPFIPGIGPVASAALTAGATKYAGGSTKDALLAGIGGFMGAKKGPSGTSFADRAKEYFTKGKDKVGFMGNLKKKGFSGIAELFGRDPSYDPTSGKGQSAIGRIEDMFKTLTGDDGKTRRQELEALGKTEAEINRLFKPENKLELMALLQGSRATAVGGESEDNFEIQEDGTIVDKRTGQTITQEEYQSRIAGRGNILSRIGGSLYDKEQGRLTGLGTAGLAGIAGVLAKLAYDEQKKQKGVPLTPLTTMDALGRYNIESEIARRTGQEMPSRVEFGLTGEGIPVLSGGRPTVSEEVIVQPPQTRMMARGGIMAFADGGVVALQEGGEPMVDVSEFPRKDGQIDGPGTETSDDIPAMLSDGEFVMTAKAVRGAGSYDLNEQNGILTLTPNGESGRDSGTRIMYKLMDHFANQV